MANSSHHPSITTVCYWVWVGLSFLSFTPIALIACLGGDWAKNITNQCVPSHEPCLFCGMTRGLCYLLEGDINATNELNKLTVWYFGGVCGSFALAAISLIALGLLKKKRKTRGA